MGLKVWLSLNGTLENNMLNGIKHSSTSGTVSYTTGKIGQALSCNGSTYCVYNGINLGSDATICCWSKTSTSKKMKWVLVCDSSDFLNIYENSFYTLNTGDSNNNPFKDASNNTVSVITDGKWHHFAVTFGNNLAKLYIDGQYRGTAQTFRSPACTNGTIKIAGGFKNTHTYDWNGALNDFRIYDNCLSPKEISELSQALILHYPLDNVAALMSKCDNITWNQLAKPTNASQSTAKNVTYSRTNRKYLNIQTTQDGVSGTGSQTIASNYLNEESIAGTGIFRQQSGHKYYSPNTLPDGFVFSINNYSYGISPYSGVIQTGVRPSNPSTIQYWSFKGNGGTVVPELVQCPLMIFDLTMMFGEGNEPTKEEFDMMFPYSYYPYDTGTVKNLKTPMPDCSGYKRNGTITGTLSLESSTPRYSRSTSFDGTSYISVPKSVKVKDEITLSVWAYLDNWTTYCDTNSTNGRFISCTQTGGWTISAESGVIKFYMGTGTSSNTYKTANASTALANLSSGWHLFTGTYDGFSSKIYIDGVLDGSSTAYSTKTPIYYHSTNGVFIGAEAGASATVPNATTKLFNGKLSDMRIYATALSADKIKELYDTSAFVDNNQNLLCYEFVEDSSSTSQIDKTGIVHSQEIDEDCVRYDYLQCDTSSWIDTGVKPTANTNFEMDISWNAVTPEDVFFGCSETSAYANGNNFSMDKLNSKIIHYAFKQSGTSTTTSVTANTIYKFRLFGNTLTINGTSYTVTRASTQPDLNLYLFARNIANVSDPTTNQYTNKCIKKLYGCKIYEGTTLIRDYVPCKYNGAAGLWDCINNQFYGNNGTGSFTLGTPVESITSIYSDKILSKQLIEI